MTRLGYIAFVALFFVSAIVGSLLSSGERTTTSGPALNATANRTHLGEKEAAALVTQPRAPLTIGHPTFVSPHARPIGIADRFVFVANTPSDTVDVIDRQSRQLVRRISVGIDPVSIAIRPDGKEVWVSNHVSDSVSVIDNDPQSSTYQHVIATIQDIDPATKATRFDEPVGIAFANNDKAYVALSSENEIAVIDVAAREVTKRLGISSQDPRAIVVRGDRLYVIPFESNNKTQLSGGTGPIDGDLTTFDAQEHVINNNNVLSLGAVSDIVKHPRVPDRDLFVFDTNTDELVETVDTLGTLLYGIAVDSTGRVFVAQTDARNDVNGRSGTQGHGLAELENRAFLNQITRVDLSIDADNEQQASFIDLEPLPPEQPEPGSALATPFAIQVSDDDQTIFVSAAGSDKLFSVDAQSGDILGRVEVDAVPRGIALESADSGAATNAWVFNAIANTVTLVDVSDPAELQVLETITLEDPTHPAVKRGRIAFNTAAASSTETFACASCHPDGHTDQLLWVLKTPVVTGGNQIMPRSTMPIRGLRDTAPYHWDGIPGDPYGGNNSANVYGEDPPNSDADDPASSTRHLIDGGLASTMLLDGDTTTNDEGLSGRLSAAERDDMATFLLSVLFPPAQRRAYTNVVSERAVDGFKKFHIEGDLQGDPRPNVCGDCHRMPFLVSTNTPGTGMDAPTWRGAYDRWLILPQGRLNLIDFDFFRAIAEAGLPERNIWQLSWAGRRRFDPVWDMVLEASTGYSGTFARQLTLNTMTAGQPFSEALFSALEQSAGEGAVVLQVDGLLLDNEQTIPVSMQFDAAFEGGTYVVEQGGRESFKREQLVELASQGQFVGTFTARHGEFADVEHPQPALWTLGPIERQRGRQDFPILHTGNQVMTVSGRHIRDQANILVDGRRVTGNVSVEADETVRISLSGLPSAGMHLLQVQNPGGLFSNDFIFHVVEDADAAERLRREMRDANLSRQQLLTDVITRGGLERVKRMLANGVDPNGHNDGGSTPLSHAILHRQREIAVELIESGANVTLANEDGNTPLHVAAFLCDLEIVELLLAQGASATAENDQGDSPLGSASSAWTEETAGIYRFISSAVGIEIDLDRIETDRPKVAARLRTYQESAGALLEAIDAANQEAIKVAIDNGASLENRLPGTGQTPISRAALYGRVEIVRLLLEMGADPASTSEDGNTALHYAAFFCNEEMVDLLLAAKAPLDAESRRGETPAETIASAWSSGLASFYTGVGASLGMEYDLERIERTRPVLHQKLLQAAAAGTGENQREPSPDRR